MNSINIPTSEMMRNASNTRPTSDPLFNIQDKPVLLQQNNPYVKSMIYENRENTYSDIINPKAMGSKSLYMNNANYKSSEAEAIDKIFEDLSYYEKTLEEMANAKLDDDFKEEMAAIEQWFSVLSECERTTVLYSLIQNISELQVRFFLTLLQQKVKNNPLFHSFIKRPISDSIYSSSTKHNSNTSSDNSSMIHSTSTETYYDEEDYRKNSFVEATTNLSQNKSPNNQFSCPLNVNEFNLAMNSLSNANFLNERSSSLARQSSKPSHSTSAAPTNNYPAATTNTTSPATARKNSYMNSMMNVNVNVNVPSPNLNVLGNMNRYNVNDSVLLNGMSNANPSNPGGMMNSQFLAMNNNTSFTNNLPLLNQTTINSLMNSYSATNTTTTTTTSVLPVLSPNTSSLSVLGDNNEIYTAPSNQNSPRVSPIRPPKPSNNTSNTNNTNHSHGNHNSNTNNTNANVNVNGAVPVTSNASMAIAKNDVKEAEGKTEKDSNSSVKTRPRNKSLTQILLTNKESKNASILTDILNLSKEMNDMVNKNKERARREKEKEKLAKSNLSSPNTPTSPSSKALKKSSSEDGETNHHGGAESVNGSTTTATPSREKGKIPDQIDLEMLKDIPVFLRSLRLHKYAPAFEGLNWKQMIRLDNDELLKRGVAALGARNKMLKVFDLIRAEAIKQHVCLECLVVSFFLTLFFFFFFFFSSFQLNPIIPSFL
jgi:hypothetical protein